MGQEFKIIRNKNPYIPQFSLVGDFDATAAKSLVEAMQKEASAERIIINTNCISRVMSGAVESHSRAFSEIRWLHGRVVFCGERAPDIVPRGAIALHF